jgi:Na+/H+ antiporter NhaD/arsenite permease-like protein
MLEVSALFAGIFLTMIPALELLRVRGGELGVREPWQFFWAAGILSSFLDNAPTYLTFSAAASGLHGTDAADLRQLLATSGGPALLSAISLGSVLMGANTYIGNGPNFMVRAIALQAGYRMPSFFAYCGWAALFLGPLLVLVTVVELT